MIKPRQVPPTLMQGPGFAQLSVPRSDSFELLREPLTFPILHSVIKPSPPTVRLATRDKRLSLPVRIGFVVNTFSFGGSETETIELVRASNPEVLSFTGVAVAHPLPLPEGEPPADGTFPPIYAPPNPFVDESDSRVRTVGSFREAVQILAARSDVIITWGVSDVAVYLPSGERPKLVVHSKDSGAWARGFLRPNSWATPFWVGNSNVAAAAFPDAIRHRVKVIHDGINPHRVHPKLSRSDQRSLWGLRPEDKVVGYLGRIEQDKGVSKTVEGVALLPHDWKAVFIGLNPNARYAGELFEHCRQRLPGRYSLQGWCHDVGSALAALDVFCHPSDHEGFSNSLGEAWLAGVPTVYTEGTGAVPDLGDLGVPVSHDAGGTEIARAIQRAFRNTELVERAQAVMRNGYLASDYARRWTEYLLHVHQQPASVRVLLILPVDLIDALSNWFFAIGGQGEELDLCCIAVFGVAHSVTPATYAAVYQRLGVPVFDVAGKADVDTLITYTRTDIVLTVPALTAPEILPSRSSPPVFVAPPDPDIASSTWVRWLRRAAFDE